MRKRQIKNFLLFNAGVDAVEFGLPLLSPGTLWRVAVDTYSDAPTDLFTDGDEPPCNAPDSYRLGARSAAILVVR